MKKIGLKIDKAKLGKIVLRSGITSENRKKMSFLFRIPIMRIIRLRSRLERTRSAPGKDM